jgi:hypothetical protein
VGDKTDSALTLMLHVHGMLTISAEQVPISVTFGTWALQETKKLQQMLEGWVEDDASEVAQAVCAANESQAVKLAKEAVRQALTNTSGSCVLDFMLMLVAWC